MRHICKVLLIGGLFLTQSLLASPLGIQVAVAQLDAPIPPAAGDTDPVQPKIDEAKQSFGRLMAASDAGDRKALTSFRPYYEILYGQASFEAVMEEPAAATAIARELDRWLAEKAQSGSPTAQFWMAERASIVDGPGGGLPDLAEAHRWYRAAAEQGFAPAQDALGQFLTYFGEFRREPYEAEEWFLRAAHQGDVAAGEHLLLAVSLHYDRPDYQSSAALLAWLQQQAETGNEKAKRLLSKLVPKN